MSVIVLPEIVSSRIGYTFYNNIYTVRCHIKYLNNSGSKNLNMIKS